MHHSYNKHILVSSSLSKENLGLGLHNGMSSHTSIIIKTFVSEKPQPHDGSAFTFNQVMTGSGYPVALQGISKSLPSKEVIIDERLRPSTICGAIPTTVKVPVSIALFVGVEAKQV
jgi:hypothetical protein